MRHRIIRARPRRLRWGLICTLKLTEPRTSFNCRSRATIALFILGCGYVASSSSNIAFTFPCLTALSSLEYLASVSRLSPRSPHRKKFKYAFPVLVCCAPTRSTAKTLSSRAADVTAPCYPKSGSRTAVGAVGAAGAVGAVVEQSEQSSSRSSRAAVGAVGAVRVRAVGAVGAVGAVRSSRSRVVLSDLLRYRIRVSRRNNEPGPICYRRTLRH